MNIEELTIGQIREISALMNPEINQPQGNAHPFIGKYVICRCYYAGVHAGTLASVNGDSVILHNSVRLWNWFAKSGVALSGVAQHGLKSGCKVDSLNPEIAIFEVKEIIPCSKTAKDSINGN